MRVLGALAYGTIDELPRTTHGPLPRKTRGHDACTRRSHNWPMVQYGGGARLRAAVFSLRLRLGVEIAGNQRLVEWRCPGINTDERGQVDQLHNGSSLHF